MKKVPLKEYNRLVRLVVEEATMHLGIDSPEIRVAKAHWLRRIRREIPYHKAKEAA